MAVVVWFDTLNTGGTSLTWTSDAAVNLSGLLSVTETRLTRQVLFILSVSYSFPAGESTN